MVSSRDLQINRKLLDSNFEGYKLSTKNLPIFSQEIIGGIDIGRPSDEQYSFLQQREFSLHNHLHHDPWNPNDVYVVPSSKDILRITSKDGLESPVSVWMVPSSEARIDGHANITICFASADTVVISNGVGSIHIISTGNRSEHTIPWKELHCEPVPEGGRIADARCVPSQLHCLYVHVDRKQTYIGHIHFLIDANGVKKVESSSVMSAKGPVDYVALHHQCRSAYVIGQIEVKVPESSADENNKNTEISGRVTFEWQQNFEEIKVWLRADKDLDPKVTVTSSSLVVKSRGDTMLQGKFARPIEDGLSVWQFVQRDGEERLEVVLSKRDEGSMWQKLFESSDFLGKEIPDADLAAEIHSRLAHLTSEKEDVGGATVLNSGQLEECDITDGEGRVLLHIDLGSPNHPKSKIELGNGQWLMSGPRTIHHAPFFCLRSDVDGLIWEIDNDCPRHIATLCAFGFVQASKASKVFSFVPSDHSYAGVLDADGRVFIYREGVRPLYKTDSGSQHIISIGKTKICGIHATNNNIFILSDHDIHLIQLTETC